MQGIAGDFAAAAADWYPRSVFEEELNRKFGKDTARSVMKAFDGLQLPPPDSPDSYMGASEGLILFLDRFGMVLRIENAGGSLNPRINDSAWVLRPIATIDAGRALIELCPGCRATNDGRVPEMLAEELLAERVEFWDIQCANVGILPLATPFFPDGVPVVIDRLAVQKLSAAAEVAGCALNRMVSASLKEAENAYYKPFAERFTAAWRQPLKAPADPQKMKAFWDYCADQAFEGKLIPGWKQNGAQSGKPGAAAAAGLNYNRFYLSKAPD